MDSTQDFTTSYLEQMTKKEKKAYEIAKSHLKTSFDLEKSIGYKIYLKQYEQINKIPLPSSISKP